MYPAIGSQPKAAWQGQLRTGPVASAKLQLCIYRASRWPPPRGIEHKRGHRHPCAIWSAPATAWRRTLRTRQDPCGSSPERASAPDVHMTFGGRSQALAGRCCEKMTLTLVEGPCLIYSSWLFTSKGLYCGQADGLKSSGYSARSSSCGGRWPVGRRCAWGP